MMMIIVVSRDELLMSAPSFDAMMPSNDETGRAERYAAPSL